MDPFLTTAGILCIVYTTAEIAAATARRSAGLLRFGAVDLGDGRELDVTVDRRAVGLDRRLA